MSSLASFIALFNFPPLFLGKATILFFFGLSLAPSPLSLPFSLSTLRFFGEGYRNISMTHDPLAPIQEPNGRISEKQGTSYSRTSVSPRTQSLSLFQPLPTLLRCHLGRNTYFARNTFPVDGFDLGLRNQCEEELVVVGLSWHFDTACSS